MPPFSFLPSSLCASSAEILRRPCCAADTEPRHSGPHRSLDIKSSTGQRYKQTMQVFVPRRFCRRKTLALFQEIKRRIQLARACYNRFRRELDDTENPPLTLKVGMETLLYGRGIVGSLARSTSLSSERPTTIPPTDHWGPGPTTHRPPHSCRTPRPSRRHSRARALRGPYANEAFSLRGPYSGRPMSG